MQLFLIGCFQSLMYGSLKGKKRKKMRCVKKDTGLFNPLKANSAGGGGTCNSGGEMMQQWLPIFFASP